MFLGIYHPKYEERAERVKRMVKIMYEQNEDYNNMLAYAEGEFDDDFNYACSFVNSILNELEKTQKIIEDLQKENDEA